MLMAVFDDAAARTPNAYHSKTGTPRGTASRRRSDGASKGGWSTRSCRDAKPRRRRHLCAGKTCQAILELLAPLSRWSGLLALELLARLLGPLLKFVLQLLLLFPELLGVGRWTVIGLGEIRERDHQADGLAGAVDALDDEPLPFLQLANQFATRFVIGHAAIVEADDIGPGHGLAVVDDHPGARLDLHSQGQGDAENLLRLIFRLDQHGCHHRHPRFDPSVLAGETNLLGVRLLALQAELGPGGKDELRLIAGLWLRLPLRCRGLRRLRRGCSLGGRFRSCFGGGRCRSGGRRLSQGARADQCGEHGRRHGNGERACGRPGRRRNQPMIHLKILLLTALLAPRAGTVAPYSEGGVGTKCGRSVTPASARSPIAANQAITPPSCNRKLRQ